MATTAMRQRAAAGHRTRHLPSDAFQLRCEREIEKLNSRLQDRLRSDILSLYDERLCADLFLIGQEDQVLAVHSCILRTRALAFYQHLLSSDKIRGDHVSCVPNAVRLPDVNFTEVQSFIRAVYSSELIENEESYFLEKLRRENGYPLTDAAGRESPLFQSANSKSLYVSEDPGISDRMDNDHFDDDDDTKPAHTHEADKNDSDECCSPTESGTDNRSSTLADVTDPFSTSVVDIFGSAASACAVGGTDSNNRSETTSLVSVEEFNVSEAVCPPNTDQMSAEHGDDPQSRGVQNERCIPELQNTVADDSAPSANKDPKMLLEDPNGVEPLESDASQSSMVAEDPCQRDSNGSDTHNGTVSPTDLEQNGVESDMAATSTPSSAPPPPPPGGDSDEHRTSTLGSVNRLQSSSDSLAKDDSLEFCPDSLACEEVFAGPAMPCGQRAEHKYEVVQGTFATVPSDHLNLVHGTPMPAAAAVDMPEPCKAVAEQIPAGTDANPMVRKHAWSEVKNMPVVVKTSFVETRCSGADVGSSGGGGSYRKPSAVITPYNASDDSRASGSVTHDDDNDRADDITLPPPPLATYDENYQRRAALDSFESKCRVQFELVPFLKESGIAGLQSRACGHVASPMREDSAGVARRHGFALVASSSDADRTDSLVDVLPRYDRSSADGAKQDLTDRKRMSKDDCRPILSGFAFDGTEAEIPEERPSGTPKKKESFFMFIDASNDPVERESNKDAAPQGPQTSDKIQKGDMFFFIPANDAPCPVLAEDRDDEKLAHQAKSSAAAAETSSTPPPVYMFIDGTAPAPSVKTSKDVVTAAGPVQEELQRRDSGTLRSRRRPRPKSESAATLVSDGNAAKSEAATRRASQVLSDEDADVRETFVRDHGSQLEDKPSTPELKYGPCSKLGEDLLKMFLEEVNPDVIVRVNGKDIKAHKSILTSRCVYFAAMLSGGWVESSGNVIKLQGFSYEAVHFALCHIYSGASSVPPTIDISELASLADMLGLEGLKEVVTLSLKMKYCHFFHKPCSSCVTGVSECLLIATSFGLDELQEKCLKWITKYMLRTWPTKSFAALPDEVHHKCLLAAQLEITVDTVLDMVMRVDKLMATLPRVKWTEPVFSLGTRLAGTCSKFLAENFASILTSNAFLALRSGQTWNIHALEAIFLPAVDRLALPVACQAYVRLHALLHIPGDSESLQCADFNENFETLLVKIHREVEHLLIHNANRVVRCSGWALLSADLQKRIKDAAVIVFDFGKPKAPPPKLSSLNRKFVRTRASNSVSSDTPSVERARDTKTDASKVAQQTHRARRESADPCKADASAKAATLPRSTVIKKAAVATTAKNHQPNSTLVHIGKKSTNKQAPTTTTDTSQTKSSSTLPLPRKPFAAGTKVQSPVTQSGPLKDRRKVHSANVATVCAKISDEGSTAAALSRPKSWPAKQGPPVRTHMDTKGNINHQTEKKSPVKESPRGATDAVPRSVGPRLNAASSKAPPVETSSVQKGPLRNGTLETKPRALTTMSTNKPPTPGIINVRDSRASSLRKAASVDTNHKGKETVNSKGNCGSAAFANRKTARKTAAPNSNLNRTGRT